MIYNCVDHHVNPMKISCIGSLSQSGVGGLPRNVILFRAALKLAGNIATMRIIKHSPARIFKEGIRIPKSENFENARHKDYMSRIWE